MDNTLASADALLQLQSAVNGQLLDLCVLFRKRVGLTSVTRTCDVRRYLNDRTDFEACVAVETLSGAAVDFWLEFGRDKDLWFVEADIFQGPEALEQYSAAQPSNVSELATSVTDACNWLVHKGQEFDFDQLR
jgi:hypothetical protein